jgi:hypothetical protein
VISGIGKGVIGTCPNTRRSRKGLGEDIRQNDGGYKNETDCGYA